MFASTCSNYGRMADPDDADRRGRRRSRPVSLYAEQKVEIEQRCCSRDDTAPTRRTCLRFATVYGVAPRMRFDLTVNEFTRDLWADRELEVFGEQFWRPYVHVRDAAPRHPHGARGARRSEVAGEVFNVGRPRRELPQARPGRDDPPAQIDRGNVTFVHRDEDPRDYKVSFDKITRAARLRDRR